jgi:hypothetical protein
VVQSVGHRQMVNANLQFQRNLSCQQEIMIFWLCSQIFEDRLLPIALHMVPIVNHPMSDRVVNTISWRFDIRNCLVADEKIEVFYSTFGREMAGLGWDRWSGS